MVRDLTVGQLAMKAARLSSSSTWGGYRWGNRALSVGAGPVLSVAEAAARCDVSVRSVMRARRLLAVVAVNREAGFYVDLVDWGRMDLTRALCLAEKHDESNRFHFGSEGDDDGSV